jgi:hypothetical protein
VDAGLVLENCQVASYTQDVKTSEERWVEYNTNNAKHFNINEI